MSAEAEATSLDWFQLCDEGAGAAAAAVAEQPQAPRPLAPRRLGCRRSAKTARSTCSGSTPLRTRRTRQGASSSLARCAAPWHVRLVLCVAQLTREKRVRAATDARAGRRTRSGRRSELRAGLQRGAAIVQTAPDPEVRVQARRPQLRVRGGGGATLGFVPEARVLRGVSRAAERRFRHVLSSSLRDAHLGPRAAAAEAQGDGAVLA